MSKHGPTTPSSLIDNWAGTGEHQDGCLVCAVRALTEGEPKFVHLENAGDEIKGVVLKTGRRLSAMATVDTDMVPYVWLWLGGHNRVGFIGFAPSAKRGLEEADAKVGDTLTIRFEGKSEIEHGRFAGKTTSRYTVTVVRGH